MPRSRKTEPLKSKDPARPPSVRGEKRVSKTGASVPVGPSRRARGTHDGPTDPAAVDRLKQVTGTDELRDPDTGKQPRQRGGGNAGRPAVGLPGKL
jgi:hypothetical protein